jgi:signal transduction histidine kinase
MTRRRRTLGAHLAWLVTLSTALGLVVFTGVAAFVIWLDEHQEADDAVEVGEQEEVEDDPFEEVLEDLGLAVAVATPLGLLVALGGARWAARRVTARIDALITTASRITADNLGERLPASARGDELDDLAAALNALLARIDDSIAALRSFAADASHELRTPLAVMISTLEIARRRPRDVAEWERVSDETLDELRRMADLTEALLQSARAGAFDLASDPVEIDGELEAIARHWRAAASAANVTIAVEAASLAEARIDPRGLAIAIGNLLGNAIAHSPRDATVTLRAARRDARVRIEVEDQGPGVPAHDRARIFVPFARGEPASRASHQPGVGLGLSITRRIVEAHGGSIDVDDAPGGGARFALELPAA